MEHPGNFTGYQGGESDSWPLAFDRRCQGAKLWSMVARLGGDDDGGVRFSGQFGETEEFGVGQQVRVVDHQRRVSLPLPGRRHSGEDGAPRVGENTPRLGQHGALARTDAAGDEDLDRTAGQCRDDGRGLRKVEHGRHYSDGAGFRVGNGGIVVVINAWVVGGGAGVVGGGA